MLSEARLLAVLYWLLAYVVSLLCLKPLLSALHVDETIIS